MQIIDILKKWFNPGDELYSPAYGYLHYVGVDDNHILTTTTKGNIQVNFLPDGRLVEDGVCMLFLSKDKSLTWELFVKNHQKSEKQFKHGDYIIFDDYENNVCSYTVSESLKIVGGIVDEQIDDLYIEMICTVIQNKITGKLNVHYNNCLEVSDARLAEKDDKELINNCIHLDNCSYDEDSGSLIVNGPKFKYGDWLRCGTECGYITYIDDDFYVLSCNGVEKNISFKDALVYEQIHGDMKPFTRVLVRNSLGERWTIAHFAKIIDGLYIVENGRKCRYCVPYCNKTKQYIDTKHMIDYFEYVEPASSYVMKR